MPTLFGGNQTTTTHSQPKPYGPAKPLINTAMNDALRDYRNGGLIQPDTTSMVTPFSNQTTQGMDQLMALSNANSGGNGMSGQLQSIMNSGGFNSGQTAAMNGTQALTGNTMLNQLANGNGLTSMQDNALNQMSGYANQNANAMQGLINNGGMTALQGDMLNQMAGYATGNAANFQGSIDRGGFDQAGQRAYQNLQNTVGRNNNALQGSFNRGGLNAGGQDALANMTNTSDWNNATFQNMFDAGGMTADQRNALGGLRGAASTITNSTNNLLGQGGLSDQQKSASDYFQNQMTTQANNPAYQQMRDQLAADTTDSVTGQYAAAGRYGSGANQKALASGLSNTLGGLDYQQYQNNLANQNNSASQLAGIGQNAVGNVQNLGQTQIGAQNAVMAGAQQGVNNQANLNSQIQGNNSNVLGANNQALAQQQQLNSNIQAGQNNVVNVGQQGLNQQQNLANNQQNMLRGVFDTAQTGVQNTQNLANSQQGLMQGVMNGSQMGVQNNANSVNALSGLYNNQFNQGQAGLGNMASAYGTAQMPAQTAMGVGAMYEDLNTRTINDAARIRAAQSGNALQNYQALLNIGNGAGAYATQNTTSVAPGQNPFLSAIGAATGIGALGKTLNLWGGPAGGTTGVG